MLDLEKVETYIRNKDFDSAERVLAAYFKTHSLHSLSVEDLNLILSWYKRMGKYREGLAFSLSQDLHIAFTDTGTPTGVRRLWAAYFFNQMGSPEFGIPLLEYLELRRPENYLVVGNIYLTQYEFQKALGAFTTYYKHDELNKDYISRINWLNIADSLAGLGDYDQALFWTERLLEATQEQNFRAIIYAARGEYFCQKKDFTLALNEFVMAESHHMGATDDIDRALLYKWQAYAQAQQCNPEDLKTKSGLKKKFNFAETLFESKGLRPEAWLDVLRLREEVFPSSKPVGHPLFLYPGLSEGYLNKYYSGARQIAAQHFGNKKHLLTIDLTSLESFENDKPLARLSLEHKLLGYLICAAPWGLCKKRALSLLWPEDYHCYLQLEPRLHNLIARLKLNFPDIAICQSKGFIKLEDNLKNYPHVIAGLNKQGPHFLYLHKSFTAKRLSDHYELSKARSAQLIQEWLRKELITVSKEGRQVFYSPRLSS